MKLVSVGPVKLFHSKTSVCLTSCSLLCIFFDFAGAIDMDFFFRDGEYYLSEINPRFGGAYLHAYGAGVDFFKLIINNINGVTNEVRIGDYDEGVLMLMYDDVVITKEVDLLRDYHD